MSQAGDGGTQMVATASGNNYFSGTSYDGGSGRQRSDSRQLGRYEWIATYEGLSIYGHTSDNKVFIRPREGCTQNGVSYCCEIPYARSVPRNQNSWVAVLDASTKPDGCRLSFATYKGGENNNPTGLVMYTGDERSGLRGKVLPALVPGEAIVEAFDEGAEQQVGDNREESGVGSGRPQRTDIFIRLAGREHDDDRCEQGDHAAISEGRWRVEIVCGDPRTEAQRGYIACDHVPADKRGLVGHQSVPAYCVSLAAMFPAP